MTPITKNERVTGVKDLIVFTESGEYMDTDLILCARVTEPNDPIAQYQAQFVKYGEIVYQFEKPEDLGQAIVAIDPESTHDAAQLWREEEARRIAREQGTLTPSEPTPAPDALEPAAIPEEEEEDVKFFKEQEAQETASTTPSTTSEEPTEPEIPVIDVTDPPGDILGTTTPDLPPATPEPVLDPIPEPEIVPIPDPVENTGMSTTTPE